MRDTKKTSSKKKNTGDMGKHATFKDGKGLAVKTLKSSFREKDD